MMKNKDTKFHQEILLDNQIKKKKGNNYKFLIHVMKNNKKKGFLIKTVLKIYMYANLYNKIRLPLEYRLFMILVVFF